MTMTNEMLCTLAQNGDEQAQNRLIQQNLPFVCKVACEIWNLQRDLNTALGIEVDDLVQEGTLGLLSSVKKFQAHSGYRFLTYAAPAIRNAILDYIRKGNTAFEAKQLGNLVSLDELVKQEQSVWHDFIPNSDTQNPEQIVVEKETYEEIHHALNQLSAREGMYLRYRFGFEDDTEHTLPKTARHFHLSESRAKKTEVNALDNVWLELPWWYG